jgi:Domain of unknown function (DUF6379)
MENNFSHSLLSESESRMSRDGIELGVRLPWYRALPLSVVEVASLTLDGRPVPANDIRLTVNGKSFALDELADLTEEVWYVLDSAVLTLHTTVEPRANHEVALQLNLYPPYIPGLTWVTNARCTIRAARETA